VQYGYVHGTIYGGELAMTKKIYHLKSLDCASCALAIESDLEDVGVNATCSYAKQTLEVEFDETKIDDEKISAIVKQSGYTLG